ncbi:glycosyltransferase family 2 protein [Jeotgalibacillus sp. ET6]|uniref:glycosyltransferase n=1 Tax=Jeotgalibacillus sp. ET6 TaxID=3037260 RepID=UPI0024188256|nr:glycosyltransferase family 2 protein [Jeotgalibacillus sp. ET6]MDG5470718.1 glycosyltransferase family 2 protein [Jeotgalibacillus sp. ET6]
MFILLSLITLFWLFVAIDTFKGLSQLQDLSNESPTVSAGMVSFIIAARNEEHTIEKSIRSQLEQTYQPVEWILVNDRSTDGTGKIMEKLARHDSRIHVVHIKKLPEGWLGKNHALHTGARKSAGNLLVFTDADVRYEPDLLAKAVAFFSRNALHHLTISPNLVAKTFVLQGFISFFLFGFSYFKRPWSANQDHKKTGMGIGAFNMLSRKAYQEIDGHQKIRMRPDDDLQLGMLVKKHGLKQRLVTGLSLLHVEWYPSLKEAIRGLEKNTFAGLHYSYLLAAAAVTGVFVSQFLPFITLFHSALPVRMMSILTILLLAAISLAIIKKLTLFSPWTVALFPLSVLLFIYAISRAVFLTMIRGGIKWRGTTYPLKEIKKQLKKS